MDARFYEVLALAMRYFFTAVGVLIVWRSFSWLMKDRRLKHRRLRQLPDAGTIGVFTVIQGGKHLPEGAIIPVPHEGVLGYLRTCDTVVPVDGVATMHIDFAFQDGRGLYIYPRRGCEAKVDGVPLASRRDSRENPMQHGSILEIGQAVLQLGVFAGFDVKEARYVPYMPADLPENEPGMPDAWYPPQNLPQQPAPYQPNPYAPPVNPAQPPYGQAPYAPYPQGNPWQGGDDHAQ